MKMLKEEVDAEDIAEIVSKWTGIPLSKMLEGEREKLLHIEENLHKRVIGQDEAINAVAAAIRRNRAGLQDRTGLLAHSFFLELQALEKLSLRKPWQSFFLIMSTI
jgi:ATP-dependent Clp protease ATP-binding subunit ClpB